jgi:hypothetical protein
MNQALYAHMNNKRKMKKKRYGCFLNAPNSTKEHKISTERRKCDLIKEQKAIYTKEM